MLLYLKAIVRKVLDLSNVSFFIIIVVFLITPERKLGVFQLKYFPNKI